MTSVSGLREAFLSYFEGNGHARRASAPLVPDNDPTLLFVNAGMVPFKNIFTGVEKSFTSRVTTSQKCVRAGGKHNDLDNVGYTARHHTFFEMLGNFSFGDYFKEDAISFAWEFVRRELDLPRDRLLVTVYSEDEEAASIWRKVAGLSNDRIIRISTNDNFWSMGDTGPCGPCSEIFFDHGEGVSGGPPGSPDEDGDRFIEIWNLVFMQFEQAVNGERSLLPKPSIDTGMGLERVAAVLQGKHNNYETDLFLNLIAAEEEIYRAAVSEQTIASFRVIGDHLRAAAFLIADGISPSNEGRGYVLRRIMRRAMRHGHGLGAREPLMYRLVNPLIGEMGSAYPELIRAQAAIKSELEQEEGRFQRTLGRGLSLLENEIEHLGTGAHFPGDTAFKLYDTYGFPLDLTEDILRNRGISIDVAGFDMAMEKQRGESRRAWSGSGDTEHNDVWFTVRDTVGSTQFSGYDLNQDSGTLRAIIVNGETVNTLSQGAGELVFDTTPFYAESGGQAGDHGEIKFSSGARFSVNNVAKRAGDVHAHIGAVVSGQITVGMEADLIIDNERRKKLRANHSATHLMHEALRQTLGEHVTQKGSLVEDNRLRFDFAHPAPLSRGEIESVETAVNEIIRENGDVNTQHMPITEAIETGALALFGEKYDDTVRVLSIGDAPAGESEAYSVELCGGTHVARTGDIGTFVILSEAGVSAGVRRIEAATGADAIAFLKARAQVATDIADQLKTPLQDAPGRVIRLVEERRLLERELAEVKKALALAGDGQSDAAEPDCVGDVHLITRIVEGVPARDLRALVDNAKQTLGSGIAVFIGTSGDKAGVSIGVTDDLLDRFSAIDLVRTASAQLGGKGGGGRPDMAQAGGPDASKAPDAIAAVRAVISRDAQ